MFRYVSTYEFIGVFYTSFLPGGVCIRKIDNHIVFAFHVQAFGNHQYHTLTTIHYQIHLPVSKAFAIGFRRTLMNACSVRDIGRFGKTVLFLFSLSRLALRFTSRVMVEG